MNRDQRIAQLERGLDDGDPSVIRELDELRADRNEELVRGVPVHADPGSLAGRILGISDPGPEDIIALALVGDDEMTDAAVYLADRIVSDLRAAGYAITVVEADPGWPPQDS